MVTLLPMIVSSFAFLDGTLSLFDPLCIIQFILHLIPIIVSMIIILYKNDVDIIALIVLTIVTFVMYFFTILFGGYTIYNLSNIYIGIFVWIVNFFLVLVYLGSRSFEEYEI